jgi:transposase
MTSRPARTPRPERPAELRSGCTSPSLLTRTEESDDVPNLHSFTAGVERDRTAVVKGLTVHTAPGPVKGTVNRIKVIKRQMHDRAKFDMLRKRILLTA